jgi:O-succinylbenzoic acid--CoA ligase
MTRPLRTAPGEVGAALREALSGGPALFAGTATDLPPTVPQRVALVVQSSGSTGNPKRVELSADALLASAAASESALGGPGHWLLALPTGYIAGLNVLVRSFAAGIEAVEMDPVGFTPERFVAASAGLDPHRDWFTSLVPAQLARLVESDAAAAVLARFSRVLLGGQAAPAALLAAASARGIAVTRTYGSSETSGGCVYDGIPIGGAQARVVDGEIQLAGPMLAEGYLLDPARTDAAFLVDGGTRWYRTGDAGTIVDGVLQVTGRLDDVIISGGIKVALGEVERLVRESVGDAVVVPLASERWGEVPVVVTTEIVDLDTLRALVSERLGAAAAPARIIRLETIPVLSSGKPDRLTIRSGMGSLDS